VTRKVCFRPSLCENYSVILIHQENAHESLTVSDLCSSNYLSGDSRAYFVFDCLYESRIEI